MLKKANKLIKLNLNVYYIYVYELNMFTHVCCSASLSILMHTSMCWVPHTCLCSCTSAHRHLKHIRTPDCNQHILMSNVLPDN